MYPVNVTNVDSRVWHRAERALAAQSQAVAASARSVHQASAAR